MAGIHPSHGGVTVAPEPGAGAAGAKPATPSQRAGSPGIGEGIIGEFDRLSRRAPSALHSAAIDRHLPPIVARLAASHPISDADLAAFAAASRADPIASVFLPAAPTGGNGWDGTVPDPVVERVELLRRVWGPFEAWWRGYFPGGDMTGAISELWRLYLPFAQWIVERKRACRPDELYMVGFNGSPGSGKTVLSSALAVLLNEILDPAEGCAVARSGDDWYLSKADREPLRALGYDPGVPGVSNRSAPGTHDLDWLIRNLDEMRRSTAGSVIRMGNFDKKADDQPTGPQRYVEVRGRVGVFLFDLWFAGARTDVDPMAVEDGLRQRVAEQLPRWRPVFERMDALWSFGWPSFDQMVRERMAQERLIVAGRGGHGMSREQIRAFMTYMVERTWDWRTTSPVPPEQAITFRALRDGRHRIIAVRRGGRAS